MKNENYEKLFFAGLLLTLLLIAAVGFTWLNETTRMEHLKAELLLESAERGGDIYFEQCTACHGATGQGGVGPALNNSRYLESASNLVMFETIRAGRPGTIMPAWSQDNGGPLTDEDIRDLVEYIRSWEEDAPDIAEDQFVPDAVRGLSLFNSSCFVCHGEDGRGGDVAPAINNPSRLSQLDNDWYMGVISNGRPAKGMPTWGTVLSPNQIDDILALISSWRLGEHVTAEFNVLDMLNSALFALSQSDPEDTIFYLDRAEQNAFGPILNQIDQLKRLVEAGDLDGAFDALAQASNEWPIGEADSGQSVYSEACSSCHGNPDEGGIGPRLEPSAFVDENSNAQLLSLILDGRENTPMNGFEGRLSVEQIADVIAYLRDLQVGME